MGSIIQDRGNQSSRNVRSLIPQDGISAPSRGTHRCVDINRRHTGERHGRSGNRETDPSRGDQFKLSMKIVEEPDWNSRLDRSKGKRMEEAVKRGESKAGMRRSLRLRRPVHRVPPGRPRRRGANARLGRHDDHERRQNAAVRNRRPRAAAAHYASPPGDWLSSSGVGACGSSWHH
jgi:hypothetical protein